MESSGSNVMCVVRSRYGVLSVRQTSPTTYGKDIYRGLLHTPAAA